MKEVRKRDRFFDFTVGLFVSTIPVSSSFNVRVLVFLVALSVFLIKGKDVLKKLRAQSWDNLFYTLVLIFGLVFTSNLETGLSVLETSFAMIAVPIVFIVPLVSTGFIYWFNRFCIGLFAACVICLVNAAINFKQTAEVSSFYSDNLTFVISSHPTYLAYHIIFTITVSLYCLFYEKDNINPYLIVVLLSFFFFVLMLTGGKTSFIGLLFTFSFFILKFLVEDRNRIRWIALGSIAVMILCMFIAVIEVQWNHEIILDDSWERFMLWEAAIKAIPNVLWGVGTGDYKDVLNSYYLTNGLEKYAEGSYNSHNQFIQTLLTNGIMGLLSILILIGRPIYLAVRNHHVLGVLVFFPFIIYGMTEVFFGRYQGVVFFALLHQVFVSYYLSPKSNPV